MKKIFEKIKKTSGETIGETLVALLISALALVMLAGAIATASGIVIRSTAKIDSYYEQNDKLVLNVETTGKSVTLTGNAGTVSLSEVIPIKYSEDEVFHVIAFRYSK